MKYTVTYACGHTGEVELFGTFKSREYKIEQLKDELCPDCAKAKHDEYVEDLQNSEEFAKLNGSEKQVSWAVDLRDKKIKNLNTLKATVKRSKKFVEEASNIPSVYKARFAKLDAKIDTAIAFYKAQTEAKYFIDTRNKNIVATASNDIRCMSDIMSINATLNEIAKDYEK